MGSPVTFSGFNNIDWSSILTAVMQQERTPLVTLEAQKTALESQASAYATLASKLSAVKSAAAKLGSSDALMGRTVSNSEPSVVGVSAGSGAAVGAYEVTVSTLARAQVMASANTFANTNETNVTSGGTITIQSGTIPPVVVEVTVPSTLQGLADAINARSDIPVYASVVGASGQYHLVLTARTPGTDNAFTVASTLQPDGTNPVVAFTDTDSDGTSGDTAADNSVQASSASLTVNGISITSASNTVENAIPGATLSLLKGAPTTPATVTVTEDTSSTKKNLQDFITAYNDLMSFMDAQVSAARDGKTNTIGRGSVLQGLRRSLGSVLSGASGTGSLQYLSQVGAEFQRTGKLSLNEVSFTKAAADPEALSALFAGQGGTPGLFAGFEDAVDAYVAAEGLVPNERERIGQQVDRLEDRIGRLEAQLTVRQQSLQAEFLAADTAMTQLNQQMSSLSSLGSQYKLF